MTRAISPEFLHDLKVGILERLTKLVRRDDTLLLALRGDSINVYYRGGSILKLTRNKGTTYSAFFDPKYFNGSEAILPSPAIAGESDCHAWVTAIPRLKEVMNSFFFVKRRKSEREFQQLVAWENNRSAISNDTEYFITDIEFADREQGSRIDMIGLKWRSKDRKYATRCAPVLIEMKYGIGAFDGSAGIVEHIKDLNDILSSPAKKSALDLVISEQFTQLDELGLLRFNRNKAFRSKAFTGVRVGGKPEVIFLLANHNPRSRKLLEVLRDVEDPSNYDLRFFVSSFAGYGMHEACMLTLDEFRAHLERYPTRTLEQPQTGTHKMDWFEKLTGFIEGPYEETRAKFAVQGRQLQSLVNGRTFGIGVLELPSLSDLRARVKLGGESSSGRIKVGIVRGDARKMHKESTHKGVLFQVASQFNMLEMTGPGITPDRGVTRYEDDDTQGPACAIPAGAATIFRNYFAPVGDRSGQNATRQLDGLADTGTTLSSALGKPVDALWKMRNGYAMCSPSGLDAIAKYLAETDADTIDALRGRLRVGIHWDVEVTDGIVTTGQTVSQAFCSALPVAYSDVPKANWGPFATLVLESAYEATLWAAVLNASGGASNTVLLTRLGGGAFGNDDDWIRAAMQRALNLVSAYDLEVKIVSYREPSRALRDLVASFE